MLSYLQCDRRKNGLLKVIFLTCSLTFFFVRSRSGDGGDENPANDKILSFPKAKIVPFFSSLATIEPPVSVNPNCIPPPLPPA